MLGAYCQAAFWWIFTENEMTWDMLPIRIFNGYNEDKRTWLINDIKSRSRLPTFDIFVFTLIFSSLLMHYLATSRMTLRNLYIYCALWCGFTGFTNETRIIAMECWTQKRSDAVQEWGILLLRSLANVAKRSKPLRSKLSRNGFSAWWMIVGLVSQGFAMQA